MSTANTLAEQPDFPAMALHLQRLGQEMLKCDNLPAVQEGQTTTMMFQNIQHTLLGITNRLSAIEERISAAEVRSEAVEANRVLITQNGLVTDREEPLRQLYSLRDGGLIASFPATVSAISTMDSPTLTAVLGHLHLPTTGSVADKRRRLTYAAGVASLRV
ncbi:uncharacterized protein B0I36DRAFT_316304 [Microdochium trichocladiopsis]|uniref:Uncharacterized protein n=1 Tax=Microdochium trichocladiopsis TaxID=1682393 RepID=A0A9P8YI98_9PEZI|nr:uncharacterized protein B0I36DRAFT_316304 [Microdochium trichocladiopsis]KAH7038453.1 hypothetical protein B0I36DRAFT_316304 [Microdochium trichocladiopsis]